MDKTSTTNEETVDQTIRRLLDEQITNDHPNFNLDFDGDSDSDLRTHDPTNFFIESNDKPTDSDS